jgi:hypothetical protein
MIRLRAADGDVTGPVKTGRGKAQFDEIRRQLEASGAEARMRQERNERRARSLPGWRWFICC